LAQHRVRLQAIEAGCVRQAWVDGLTLTWNAPTICKQMWHVMRTCCTGSSFSARTLSSFADHKQTKRRSIPDQPQTNHRPTTDQPQTNPRSIPDQFQINSRRRSRTSDAQFINIGIFCRCSTTINEFFITQKPDLYPVIINTAAGFRVRFGDVYELHIGDTFLHLRINNCPLGI
jgi:hypothetical protein